jgi:hypothetical protein
VQEVCANGNRALLAFELDEENGIFGTLPEAVKFLSLADWT